MAFTRYVALGDSFTEGVGDPDAVRPNGLRGWADRVAEVLAATSADFGYANLAIRGRTLPQVLAEQVEPALALTPDLVTIYAGGNDLMRPRVDIDDLVARYHDALQRLAQDGAHVVVFTGFDPGGSALFGQIRGRFAIYNELVREAVERVGCDLVDFWRFREFRDWRYWGQDRIHLSSAGHQLMATKVLDHLGIPHELGSPDLGPQSHLHGRARLAADAAWAREHAVPWVGRRLTGRSSGDGVTPKRPTLESFG